MMDLYFQEYGMETPFFPLITTKRPGMITEWTYSPERQRRHLKARNLKDPSNKQW